MFEFATISKLKIRYPEYNYNKVRVNFKVFPRIVRWKNHYPPTTWSYLEIWKHSMLDFFYDTVKGPIGL